MSTVTTLVVPRSSHTTMTNASNLDSESLNPSLYPSGADDRRRPATADCPGTIRHRESTVNIGEGIRNSNQEARGAALRVPSRVKRRTGQTDVLRALENRHRWLLFAQHCYTCVRPEEACKLGKLCTYGKKTLKHVAQCKRDDCSYPRCRLLRPLLQHSRKCQSTTCAICVPVWNYIQKETQQQQQEQHQEQQAIQVLQPSLQHVEQQQQQQRAAVPQRPAASSAGPPPPRAGGTGTLSAAPTPENTASFGRTGHQGLPTTTTIAPATITTAMAVISRQNERAAGTTQLDKSEGAGSTCGAIGIGRPDGGGGGGADRVAGSVTAKGVGGRLSFSGEAGGGASAVPCAGGGDGDGCGCGSGGARGGVRGGDTGVENLEVCDRPEVLRPTFLAHQPPGASNLQPHPQPQQQLQPHSQPPLSQPLLQQPQQQQHQQQHPAVPSSPHCPATKFVSQTDYPVHLQPPPGVCSQSRPPAEPVTSEPDKGTRHTVIATPAEPIPAANCTALPGTGPPLPVCVSSSVAALPPAFHFVHSYPAAASIGAYFPHLTAPPHLTAHGGHIATPFTHPWWHFPAGVANHHLPGAAVNGLPLPLHAGSSASSGGAALPGGHGAARLSVPASSTNAMWPNATHVQPNAYGIAHEGARPTVLSGGGLAPPLGMAPPADQNRYGHPYRMPGTVSTAAASMTAPSLPLAPAPVPAPMVLWTSGPPPPLPAAGSNLPHPLTAHHMTAPHPPTLNTAAAACTVTGPHVTSGCGHVSLATHPRACLVPPVQPLAPHALLYGHGGLLPAAAAAAPGPIASGMPGAAGASSASEPGSGAALRSCIPR